MCWAGWTTGSMMLLGTVSRPYDHLTTYLQKHGEIVPRIVVALVVAVLQRREKRDERVLRAVQAIVEEAERHDALIVTDEVYEHLTFGPAHLPPATLPGAQDRTISISSAGKTFAVTGWKIGWITATSGEWVAPR